MIIGNRDLKLMLESQMLMQNNDDLKISPASIDLRLAGEFINEAGRTVHEKSYLLTPRSAVKVLTKEKLDLPEDVAGLVKLRSTLGRNWINMLNAGWVDPGFKGPLSLTLENINNLTEYNLNKNDRFAQIIFFRVAGCDEKYKGQYQA